MSTSTSDDVSRALDGLRIEGDLSRPHRPTPSSSVEHNPWQDDKSPNNASLPQPLNGPIPSLIDDEEAKAASAAFARGDSGTSSRTVPINADVLHEFDPLAAPEGDQAREAWAHTESHPPPPALPSKLSMPPPPPPKIVTETKPGTGPINGPQTPTSASGIPNALAALARSFSLPGARTRQQRPQSIDAALAVPSPATLSSFASQQQQTQPSKLKVDTSAEYNGRAVSPGSPIIGHASPAIPGKVSTEDQAFDFQTFLDQMKLKGAEPVAKYLRSFLSNFAKRSFTVGDQVKLINDFLQFIAEHMRQTDVWRDANDVEFDNAMEGMEKLVMNRLYDYTFTPHIAAAVPPRPITSDDLERDRVLTQRIALFGWLEPKHLDVPDGEGSQGFLMFAEQELLKINHYKAPRDKLICILNCCKVIFGLIRHLKKDEGADSFVPILIFAVIKANPDHLLSNVEFINRFRNPEKLQSEAGYYLSSLMGAVSFIETMDHASLSNITQEEFEKNVEAAIQKLPPSSPRTPDDMPDTPGTPSSNRLFSLVGSGVPSPATPSSHTGEEAAQPLAISIPSISEDARRLLAKTGDSISRPLSALGRMFNEVLDNVAADVPTSSKLTYLPGPFTPFQLGAENRREAPGSPGEGYYAGNGGQIQTPYKPRVRRAPSSATGSIGQSYSWGPEDTPTRLGGLAPPTHRALSMGPSSPLSTSPLQAPPSLPPRIQSLTPALEEVASLSRTPTPGLDFAGMQAEIDAAHDRQSEASHETLAQIFPTVDNEVIDMVLEANGGDLGRSIEALLEMSVG